MIDAQNFLYWALGAGFLLLVIFMCVALLQLIRILRDIADASDAVKETAEKVNVSVTKVADKLAEATDQVSDYVIKPFAVVKFLAEKVTPFMDLVAKKHTSSRDDDEEDDRHKKKKWGKKR